MVVIRNTGANDLTSLTINYWINGAQSPQTFEWEGNLAFMEEEEVTIPSTRDLWADLLDENNRFNAEVSNPNGTADEYTFNNTKNSSFEVPIVIPYNMEVSFRTNSLPVKNSYQLINSAGEVVGSNNLPAANFTYNDSYSMSADCYTLSVNDTGGDGLEWFANPGQGSGTIRLRNENGISLRAFEPDFGGGFEFNFSTNFPVSAEEIEFLTSIEVYPNPSSHFCTIKANDLSKATVQLTDILERNVSTNITSQFDNAINLDVKHLDAGIFFNFIERDDLRTTRKLVVE